MDRRVIVWIIVAFIGGGIFAALKNVGDTLQGEEHNVRIFFIDSSQNDGTCDDKTVETSIKSTFGGDPITDALQALFTAEKQDEKSHLHNALSQSDLSVNSAKIQSNKAIVELDGALKIADDCAARQITNQLQDTILMASKTEQVQISLNGKPLQDAIQDVLRPQTTSSD